MNTRRGVVEAWDAAARTPEARQRIHPAGGDLDLYERSGMAMFREVQHLAGLDRELRVMDFGSGDGRVTVPLACYYHDVLAVDASPTMLARLQERAPIPTLLSDGSTLPESRFDVVVCIAVLIHHSHADAAAIIGDLAGSLRPGGRLVQWLPLYEEGREPDGWIDLSCWTLQELEETCRRVGLGVEVAPTNPGVFTWEAPGLAHSAFTVLVRK